MNFPKVPKITWNFRKPVERGNEEKRRREDSNVLILCPLKAPVSKLMLQI